MIYEKFGHKIEFEMTGSSLSPDQKGKGLIGLAAMYSWVNFGTGWISYSSYTNHTEFMELAESIDELFEHLMFTTDQSVRIKTELRDKKIDDSDVL